MLRYLAPHLTVAVLLAIVAGVGYGADLIGVLGFYGCLLAAGVTVIAGGARWEQRQLPRHHRH